MPEIRAFPALRYRYDKEALAAVLAPPYDVIPPDYAAELERRHPQNVVRAVLNRAGGPEGYAAAGATFRGWQADGALVADPEPSLYLLEQSFEVDGAAHVRRGLLARFRAEDPERGIVLPHEHTRKAAKEDRYLMLKATRANFSPIFLMFPDAGARFARRAATVVATPPTAQYTDDAGVTQRLWRLSQREVIEELTVLLGAAKAYIADGHHRHATALRHRNETGPDGAWTLGYFTPLDDPGLVVLPYHRIASQALDLAVARRALVSHFDVRDVPGGARAVAQAAAASSAPWAFALATKEGQGLLAESRPSAAGLLDQTAPACLRVLDTFFLHKAVLGPLLGVGEEAIDYVHSLGEAESALSTGRAPLAILLRPTRVQQIVDVADARESMPAKSTFFHPKLPSGLVIHPLIA